MSISSVFKFFAFTIIFLLIVSLVRYFNGLEPLTFSSFMDSLSRVDFKYSQVASLFRDLQNELDKLQYISLDVVRSSNPLEYIANFYDFFVVALRSLFKALFALCGVFVAFLHGCVLALQFFFSILGFSTAAV